MVRLGPLGCEQEAKGLEEGLDPSQSSTNMCTHLPKQAQPFMSCIEGSFYP